MSLPDQAYCDKFYNRTVDLMHKYKPDLIYFDDDALPLWPVSDAGLKIAAEFYNFNIKQHDGKLEAVILGKQLNDEERKCIVWDLERGAANRIEPLPWETDTCIGNWHYERALYDNNRYKNARTVIRLLADIVSKNGNLLLNIPVRSDGTIDDKEEAVLQGIAAWMDVNKECIFGTRPWKVFGEGPASEGPVAPGRKFHRRQRQAIHRRGCALYVQGWDALCHRAGRAQEGICRSNRLARRRSCWTAPSATSRCSAVVKKCSGRKPRRRSPSRRLERRRTTSPSFSRSRIEGYPSAIEQLSMKTRLSAALRGFLAAAFLSVALTATALRAADGPPVIAKPAANVPVTVADNGRAWTLDNGLVKAVIDKRNGAMNSLFYGGIDTMGHDQGQSGYWEQDPSAAASGGGLTDSITINPEKNGGERGEVSVKGVTGGQFQLTPALPVAGLIATSKSVMPWGAGTAESMSMRFSPILPTTVREASDRRELLVKKRHWVRIPVIFHQLHENNTFDTQRRPCPPLRKLCHHARRKEL